jgi:hypothetical protein
MYVTISVSDSARSGIGERERERKLYECISNACVDEMDCRGQRGNGMHIDNNSLTTGPEKKYTTLTLSDSESQSTTQPLTLLQRRRHAIVLHEAA